MRHFPQVNQSGCVKVLTNFYLTPLAVDTTAEARVSSAYVEIWYGGCSVARHERCYQRQQQVLELNHYLDVLMKKPGEMAGSTALEQCRVQGRWPACLDRFWSLASERLGRQAGTRDDRCSAVEWHLWRGKRTPSCGRSTGDRQLQSERGRYLLSRASWPPSPQTVAVEVGDLRRYDRPQPSMDVYEQLRPNWALTTEVIQ